jgi:predicted Fe-Mo cluster-binding NifX family protein
MASDHSKATASSSSSAAACAASQAGRDEGLSAGAASQIGLSAREEFVIDCLRNARYHEDRERFFARIHKIAMFFVVASGTATFAWIKGAPIFAAVITLAGLLDLVFDISGKARLHAALRRRIYDVLAQSEDSTRGLESLREQAVRVYADEPPCMHAANMIAFNGAMQSFHRPHEHLYKIEWYHRLLRHVWPFASTRFKTYGEIAKHGSV